MLRLRVSSHLLCVRLQCGPQCHPSGESRSEASLQVEEKPLGRPEEGAQVASGGLSGAYRGNSIPDG